MSDRNFHLYELSVQTPTIAMDQYATIYRELRGREPRRLREDFGGTFAMSCDWVKRDPLNTATVVELERVPLDYGRRRNLPELTPDQRRRVKLIQGDVLEVCPAPVDFVVAGNFSFYVFHERRILVDYFRNCLRGLAKDGIVCLEMAGGPGMIETTRERKRVRRGSVKQSFTYVWDQKSFDPITHRAHYGIHFHVGDRKIVDAFTYNWRLWTIPEVRDALAEAGFRASAVWWETEHKGEGTGEYVRMDHGDNAFSWIAYVVGIK